MALKKQMENQIFLTSCAARYGHGPPARVAKLRTIL